MGHLHTKDNMQRKLVKKKGVKTAEKGVKKGAKGWKLRYAIFPVWFSGDMQFCTPPPPHHLYKLRPCLSCSRRTDRVNLGPNLIRYQM